MNFEQSQIEMDQMLIDEDGIIVICLDCKKGKNWMQKHPDLPIETIDETVIIYQSCGKHIFFNGILNREKNLTPSFSLFNGE